MRETIAAILRYDQHVELPHARDARQRLVRSAVENGVVVLVSRALAAYPIHGRAQAELAVDIAEVARIDIAQAMFRDAEIARVLDCLSVAGEPVLLLKGAALASWLYEQPELRSCGDIDILLRERAAVEGALVALGRIGFASDISVPPGDLVGYQLCCRRKMKTTPGWEIDLHWKLSNSPIFVDVFSWDELLASARAIPRLGSTAFGLSTVHAFLHACVHRAVSLQFGEGNKLRSIYDIHLLASQLTSEQWKDVATLCARRRLAGACRSALVAAERDFHTPLPPEVMSALSQLAQGESLRVEKLDSWVYSQWATLLSIQGIQPRLRWLRQRIIPDREYLRQTVPAGDYRLGRALALRLKMAVVRIRQGRRW